MIRVICEQGSDAWKRARAGLITASEFADARARYKTTTKYGKAGDFTETATVYHFRKAIERISGEPLDGGYETWQMERGHELEPEARRLHETLTGHIVERVGFIMTDDRRFGASLDGEIGEDGSAEYKAFIAPDKLHRFHIANEVGDVYEQVQGGLWISGRKWCEVGVYCPALAPCGRELWLRRIYRDDDFIFQLERDLVLAARQVDRFEAELRKPMPEPDLQNVWPFPNKGVATCG